MSVELKRLRRIVVRKKSSEVVSTAAEDLKSYLHHARAIDLDVVEAAKDEGVQTAESIFIRTRGEQDRSLTELDTPESFLLEVTESGISICGADDRGALYGTFYLEEVVGLTDGGELTQLRKVRKPRLKYRIGTVTSNNFSDEELRFLAKSAVNCLHLFHYCWMEQLTPSKIFPEDGELVRRDEKALASINDIFGRAQKFGMECYLFVRGVRPSSSHRGAFEHRFMETGGAIFDKYPDVKGSNLGVLDPIPVRGQGASWHGSNTPLCFSSENLRRFIEETCENLYREIPNLKGMIVEPMDATLWCDDTCDACRGTSFTSRIAEYVALLDEAAKRSRKDAKVLLYHWGFPFIRAERDKLIQLVPKDVVVLNAYTDGIEQIIDGDFLHHGGYYDITVNVSSPGRVYLADCRVAQESGHEIVTWITAGSSNEFKGAPYVPVPYNIAKEIFDSIRAGSAGVFEHGGPDKCIGAEVFKWAVWEPEERVHEILQAIAKRDYGSKAAPLILDAWRALGDAVNRQPVGYYYLQNLYQAALAPLFPAEDLVSFMTGIQRTVHLAQLEKLLHMGEGYLQKLVKYYDRTAVGLEDGIALLVEALSVAEEGRHQDNIRAEMNMSKACASIVRSKVSFLRFVLLLMDKAVTSKPWLMEEMAQIIEREIDNSQQLKKLVEIDRRIGYNMWEGWVFTPQNLGKRILAMQLHLQKLRERGFYVEYINAWR
jgi:hypothetical protein